MSRGSLYGFTVIEVTVALLLSSIIIVMIYYVLTISEKEFVDFRSSNLYIEKIAQVNERLSTDFEFSDIVIQKESELDFKRSNSADIIYLIKPDCIVRVFDNVHDTFPLKVKDTEALLFHNKITGRSHIIDELKLVDDKGMIFDFAKKYASDQLIQLDSTINLN